MNDYIIITDTAADLTEQYCKDNNLEMINFPFNVDGNEYTGLDEMPMKDFYDMMRSGSIAKTAQIPMETFENEFTKHLKNGIDILYIGFSSNLSGTFNSARIVSEQLSVKYPERKINIIDSLCASLGLGLLASKAVLKKKEGLSLTELTDWIEDNKLNIVHIFTVDDLVYLHRGGRVSKTAVVAGSILGIKPILHVNNEGKLIPQKKIRGRKQSFNELLNTMEERVGSYKNVDFTLAHADCAEDAEYIANEVKRRFKIKNGIVNMMGPIIGAHAGPGTIALFMTGERR